MKSRSVCRVIAWVILAFASTSFEPQFIEKGQTRLTQFDDQILACYARGMSTRDIAQTFEEMFGAHVSHHVISQVTEAVWEQVQLWQNRPLDELYPKASAPRQLLLRCSTYAHPCACAHAPYLHSL